MKKLPRYYLIVVVILITQYSSAQVSLGTYALTNATIIDVKNKKLSPEQTIIIRNNKMDRIVSGTIRLPDSIIVINLHGKYVIPGLIDSHVHLATDPSEIKRPAIEEVLSRMLYSGITSVRDMAGDARTLAGLSRDAIVGDINSPDIYYAALMAGPEFFTDPRTASSTQGGIDGEMPYMRAITDSSDLRLIVAEAKGSGATGIKLYANLSGELVKKVVAEANKQNIIVWAHAALFPAKPTEVVDAGVNVISHAPMLSYEVYENKDSIPAFWKNKENPDNSDGFWNSEEKKLNLHRLFNLMKEKGTILDATLSTYKNLGQENPKYKWEVQIGYSIVRQAHKEGVKISAGTDTDQKSFVQEEIKLLVNQCGFTPIEAIIAATEISAEAIGISDTHGTIETGKAADLLILEKNPVNDINNIDSVFMVIKSGRIYKK